MYNYQYFIAYTFEGKQRQGGVGGGVLTKTTKNGFRDVVAQIDNPDELRYIENALVREAEQNGWYDIKVVIFNFILIKTF